MRIFRGNNGKECSFCGFDGNCRLQIQFSSKFACFFDKIDSKSFRSVLLCLAFGIWHLAFGSLTCLDRTPNSNLSRLPSSTVTPESCKASRRRQRLQRTFVNSVERSIQFPIYPSIRSSIPTSSFRCNSIGFSIQHSAFSSIRIATMPPQAQHHERNSREHNNNNHNTCNDHASTSGETNSVATPSSVYMPSSIALSRDNMSDLSGISGDRSSSNQVPGQILDPKSLLRPWSQAYSLSPKPPDKSHMSHSAQTNKNPLIWVAENDVVEIFDDLESSLGLDRFQIRKHDRIPIMVLLMDPCKQTYELMQIWVDRANDSIRDLVQVLQHKLPNQWKQAYDGLFQVRGNRFTQLINIIKLVKYDMQPNEILIAKPWSMAAKVA